MTQLYSDSIFWIETEKINPNPYQPRKEFDEAALEDLAESIRQYGVLQPLVVTRHEYEKEDGGIGVHYELIAGERRLRGAKLAAVKQVPAIIRSGEDNSKMKLELSIIENLQREDLNPIDRARAFMRLVDEFSMSHSQIGKKMGKSREYISNTMRLLQLPQEIMDGLEAGKIGEGHARTLMMLNDKPDEQSTLFKEVVYKKMSVRETEQVARSIAKDKVRKKDPNRNPEIDNYQQKLSESLGTRVHIEPKEVGGKIVIDYFSSDDLRSITDMLEAQGQSEKASMLERYIQEKEQMEVHNEDANTIQPPKESASFSKDHASNEGQDSLQPPKEYSSYTQESKQLSYTLPTEEEINISEEERENASKFSWSTTPHTQTNEEDSRLEGSILAEDIQVNEAYTTESASFSEPLRWDEEKTTAISANNEYNDIERGIPTGEDKYKDAEKKENTNNDEDLYNIQNFSV